LNFAESLLKSINATQFTHPSVIVVQSHQPHCTTIDTLKRQLNIPWNTSPGTIPIAIPVPNRNHNHISVKSARLEIRVLPISLE